MLRVPPGLALALLVAPSAAAADPLLPAPTPVPAQPAPIFAPPAPTTVSPAGLLGDHGLGHFSPGAPQLAVHDPSVCYEPGRNCPPYKPDWKKQQFPAGSWVYQIYAGEIFLSDDARFRAMKIGFGNYWWDGWSFNVEFTGLVGEELAGNGGRGEGGVWGGSVDLIGRWHLWVYENWSFYWDAGLGFSELSRSIPNGGTAYNFTLQSGAGWTINMGQRTRLMLGGKWFHLSNGNFFNRQNPGYDGLWLYAGVMWRY